MAWNAVTDTMLSEGRLLTPEISYNMMERDWSAFSVPVDWIRANQVYQQAIPAHTWDITCVFPESWGLDTALDSDAQLRLVIYIQIKKVSHFAGSVGATFTVNPVTSVSGITSTTFAWYKLERYWDGTLPTGPTDAEITMTFPGTSDDLEVQRLEGTGPDSYYWLNFTS